MPEPETPVKTTSRFFGMRRETFLRLLVRAPVMTMASLMGATLTTPTDRIPALAGLARGTRQACRPPGWRCFGGFGGTSVIFVTAGSASMGQERVRPPATA
ncbi:hypothetical protein GCM10010404_23050 [Nonomuraea africana]